MSYRLAFAILSLCSSIGSCIKVFQTPGELPNTIPLSCRTALAADINCQPDLISAEDVVRSTLFPQSFLQSYCVPGCRSSLDVSLPCSISFFKSQRGFGIHPPRRRTRETCLCNVCAFSTDWVIHSRFRKQSIRDVEPPNMPSPTILIILGPTLQTRSRGHITSHVKWIGMSLGRIFYAHANF